MPSQDDTRPCKHRDETGNICKGTQTYQLARRYNVAGPVSESGVMLGLNPKTRSGWECSESYPDHFDEE